jgi:hypothetical protein
MPYRRVTDASHSQSLKQLLAELMRYLQNKSTEKTITTKAGQIRYQEFHLSDSKPILDNIDRTLAQHYGFTDEELDFIINYDIKYRISGVDGEGEDD